MSCSFCRSRDHNIRGCNSPMIGILYERIKAIYLDIMTYYPVNIGPRFNSALISRFTLRELRAVCATMGYLRASSHSKLEIIRVLYIYLSNEQRPHNEEPEWLEVRRLPTEPDPIPEYARDLEEAGSPVTVIQGEPDITWYIDRTPTPVSLLRFATFQEPSPQRLNIGIMRNFVGVNLMSHFDAVSGNIPFAPQIKKYGLHIDVDVKIEEGVEECAICYESIECMDLVKLNCNHKFCGSCIKQSLKAHNNMYRGPSCALCRKEMDSFTVKNPEIYNLMSEHCQV